MENRLKVKKILFGVVIILFFLGLRLYKIEERTNFSMDQGIFLLKSWEIWKNKELVLVGPPASPLVNGRNFFQGPLIYYSITLMGLIGNWDPLMMAVTMVFLTLVGGWFLYIVIKEIWGKETAIIGFILLAFCPILVNYSNFLWNPNFLLLLTPIYLLMLARAGKTNKKFWYGLAGVSGGIALQFHFQFGPIIGVTLLVGFLLKKNWREFGWFLVGLMLGYLPLIVFDIRNNGYNIRTIFEWLGSGQRDKTQLQWHYVLSYLVVLIIPVAISLNRVNKKIKWIIIGSFVLVSTVIIGLQNNNNEWNLIAEKKVIDKILVNGCPKNFAVAETINGDTRAYDVRYLLTIRNCPPMGVEEYPKAKTLFLIAPPERPPKMEKVWEVSSLGKNNIREQTKINEKVILF